MELLLAIVVLALGHTVTSTYGTNSNNDAVIQFPVLHKNHPLLSSQIQRENIPGASVTGDDSLREDVFFMAISLGTPAVVNLVTIDTGSSLSWVQCQHCDMHCYWQARKVGPIFNPFKSSTFQNVGCSTEVCDDIHKSSSTPYGCAEEKDACLYRIRYALGEYSVGYLGKDKLTLPNNYTIDDFVFGCGADNLYKGFSAGVIGFGNESYSFFNQVAQQANYRAFSYCFPSNHESAGFLSVGPYARDENLMLTSLISYDHFPYYAIQQLDMMVNGVRLEIDPRIYSTALTIVDSGTTDTFILPPVFHALDMAVTMAMQAKGYARRSVREKICFVSGDSINWNDLPTIEMKFIVSTLALRMENVFYVNSDDDICLTFRPNDGSVSGVQLLGNRALRSFRVVYDIQNRIFGFQAGAC
ncbi:hypothetical protein ACP4OV_014562 [Aristida adscensionis]